MTAGAYTGFHGRPVVDVSVERYGRSHEVNLDGSPAPCGDVNPDRDGSACGLREFKSRLALPKTAYFGLQLRGDRFEYSRDCPYPEATPSLAEDFYESTSIIGENESKIDWYPRLFGTCDSHSKHCRADIEWTAKFRRVTKAHTGR